MQSATLRRRLALGLVFGFLVLLASALLGDLRQVGTSLQAFRWSFFPAILALTLFNYTLRCFKWRMYLGLIGAGSLSWMESARLFVAGFPLAVTPGKVGEALKGVWLYQASGVPVARGMAVVVAERVSDGLAVLALSTLGVIAYPRFWPGFAAVLAILSSLILLTQIQPFAQWCFGMMERMPLASRFTPALRQFYAGSYALFRPKPAFAAVGLGILSWLGEGVGMYLVLIGLGIAPGVQNLSTAIFVLSFSTIVGAVSTLPGGLGAAEASIGGMLVLLLGATPALAASATLLIRFATLWFGVALGLLVWAFSPGLLGIAQR